MCYVTATTDDVLRATVCAVDANGDNPPPCIPPPSHRCPAAGTIGDMPVTPERVWVQWEVLRDCVAGVDPS